MIVPAFMPNIALMNVLASSFTLSCTGLSVRPLISSSTPSRSTALYTSFTVAPMSEVMV